MHVLGVRARICIYDRLTIPTITLFSRPSDGYPCISQQIVAHSEMSLHLVYSKIRVLIKAFLESILVQRSKVVLDGNR